MRSVGEAYIPVRCNSPPAAVRATVGFFKTGSPALRSGPSGLGTPTYSDSYRYVHRDTFSNTDGDGDSYRYGHSSADTDTDSHSHSHRHSAAVRRDRL